MIRKQTFIVNSAEDELEIFFTKENTIRMYITPDGDTHDFMRHGSFDIESVEDLDEIISQLNSFREDLITSEKDNL
jgi:hypothetical protein